MKIQSLLFTFFISFIGFSQSANIYSNSSTGDDLTGDGTSGNPYQTFHKAYQMVTSGGTINLSGTFDWSTESGNAVTSGYTIAKNITIIGEGSDQTIIQAHATPNTTNRRIFTINSSVTVTIQKVHLRNGRVANLDNSVSTANGGAIYNNGALTLSFCRFSANYALAGSSYSGGAGGAILHNVNNTCTINACTFDNNQAKCGGALANNFNNSNGKFIITNSTFAFNKQLATVATVGGGAIWILNATNVITNCTFHANELTTGTGNGASILVRKGSVRLKNNIFVNGKQGGVALGTYESEIDYSGGSATDDGNNIIGKQYAGISSPKTTSFYDSYVSTSAADGVFTKYNSSPAQNCSISINNTLALNGATNGTFTLETSGVSQNNGSDVANNGVSIPTVDQRGVSRINQTDIGSYESNVTAPVISSTSNLSSFSTNLGTPSVEQSFSVSGTDLTGNMTITAPTGFEVSTTSGSNFTASVSLTPVSGTVSSTTIYLRLTGNTGGSLTGNVTAASLCAGSQLIAVTGNVTVPIITATPSTLTGFSSCLGTESASQTTSISGSNLTTDITLTAPTGYEVSLSSASNFGQSLTLAQTNGSVPSTTLYVRLTSTATAGANNGNLTAVSGSNSANVALSGTVQSTSLSGSTISSTTTTIYCLNAQATALTVNAPNATSFQWMSLDAANWAGQESITGATTNTYTPPTNVVGTKYYRCAIASCSGSNTSSPVSGAITVTDGSVWTGTVSTDPTNSANWSTTCGSGNKIINAGTIYSPEYINLSIANGETITIIEGAQVTVTGVLTNDGTLNINSGATLVQGVTSTYAGTGAINVGQRITGGSTAGASVGRFWYLGTPVTGANATAFYSTSATNIVKERDEPTNAWNSVANNSGVALTPGKGYYVRANNGTTSSLTQTPLLLSFAGGSLNNNPTSSAMTINCTRSANVSSAGFNLVSNPYPSYLNWDAVTKNNVGNTMWYRSSTGSFWSSTMVFETYVAGAAGGIGTNLSGNVATRLIPPMQAFWVRVNSGSTTGSITLDNSMRSHFVSLGNSTAGLRSTNDELKMFLRMNLLYEDKKDQLIVYINNAATDGFDVLDGEKMMQATLPQFYTKAGDKNIVINGLNAAKKQQSLPITMELPTTGVHSFEIENLQIESGLVWIEDAQAGTIEPLTEGYTYQFYGEAGINSDRFVLHFNLLDITTPSAPNYGEVNSSANFSGKGASVYAETAGVVVIKLPATTEGITDIQIRDAAGRLVYTGATNTLETSVQLAQANGIYYVTLNSASGVEVRKVFIQQ
jgi:hypothetical protein